MKIFSSFLLLVTISCTTKSEDIKFNFDEFIISKLNDSTALFIQYSMRKDFSKCSEISQAIVKIDVGNLSIDDNGDKYLAYLGNYITPFLNSSNEVLKLGIYLKYKYNLKNSLFDQILRESIRIENGNILALYLLAQLRFYAGYEEDSFYIISIIKDIEPANSEITRLYEEFRNKLGEQPVKPESFEEYLKKNYYYLKE
ncbi:hypothetical protein [Reichenbachiella sp. MALMAid0571]|uniref:hypothetical protein n=1 Tax=Reichenbachiella sp. MALMAid0571 TaxID=3143939 RepID=UPI0032E01BD8